MSLKERLEIDRSCLFFMYILRRVAFCYFIIKNHQLFEFSHSFEHSYPMCRVFDKPLWHSIAPMPLNDPLKRNYCSILAQHYLAFQLKYYMIGLLLLTMPQLACNCEPDWCRAKILIKNLANVLHTLHD